jgi:hypothetical protein
MQTRFLMCCFVLAAVALGCTTAKQSSAHTGAQAQGWRTLTNDVVGYSLSYPRAWKLAGRVVATQFASGSRCQSVRIVDRATPSEVRQSLLQSCWKPVADGSSLDTFMRRTYRSRLSRFFIETRLGGVPAYRSRTAKNNRTFFLQTRDYRVQLIAAVVAAPARRVLRQSQVNRILASFSVRS